MLSNKLKQRFCKDYNVPIDIYVEPIFTERLRLFGAEKNFRELENMIRTHYKGDEQSFLEDYNKLKDDLIAYIKETNTYKQFNEEDISKFKTTSNIPQKDVYKEDNIGKKFISIDMKKANYTIFWLYDFNKGFDEFGDNYTDFIKKFTNMPYFINSKYLRQVVFGNCNPKRQIKLEKWRMEKLADQLNIPKDAIYSFNNDEIILDADKISDFQLQSYKEFLGISENIFEIDIFKVEEYTLEKIKGSDAYIKRFSDNTYELKCLPKSDAVFVYRFLKGEELTDNDYIFMSPDKRLAKYLEAPELEIIKDNQKYKDKDTEDYDLE